MAARPRCQATSADVGAASSADHLRLEVHFDEVHHDLLHGSASCVQALNAAASDSERREPSEPGGSSQRPTNAIRLQLPHVIDGGEVIVVVAGCSSCCQTVTDGLEQRAGGGGHSCRPRSSGPVGSGVSPPTPSGSARHSGVTGPPTTAGRGHTR